jgi:hypothetical protein
MKFKDPYSIVCSTCGVGSKLPVKELLARQAKCPSCGQLLTDVNDRMHAALDKWSDHVAAIVLTVQLEEQNSGLRYDDAVLDLTASSYSKVRRDLRPTNRRQLLSRTQPVLFLRAALGTNSASDRTPHQAGTLWF